MTFLTQCHRLFSLQSVDEQGLFGESPYIGKGRFQKHERARQARIRGKQVDGTETEGSGSGDTMSLDSETRARLHAELDQELALKREAIGKGSAAHRGHRMNPGEH